MKLIKRAVIILTVLISISCVSSGDNYSSENEVTYKKILFSDRESLVKAHLDINEYGLYKLSINSPLIPGMTINGQVSREEGQFIYYVTDVRLFSNWNNGWTEGFYEASGKYLIKKEALGYKFVELDSFELWDIIRGEIRYHDTYYRKDDGMWKVKNRVDRLKEVSRVLHKDFNLEPIYGSIDRENSLGGKFSEAVYPILFPELNKFEALERENKLPKEYYLYNSETTFIQGSGINWRDDYTKSVFPEQLWELRNTGTMFRDVQEAPNIFFSLYNLEGFIEEILLKETILKSKE